MVACVCAPPHPQESRGAGVFGRNYSSAQIVGKRVPSGRWPNGTPGVTHWNYTTDITDKALECVSGTLGGEKTLLLTRVY